MMRQYETVTSYTLPLSAFAAPSSLEAMTFTKGRRSAKDSLLNESEFKEFRSLLYRVSWVAHQTRPEAAGTASILSSRLHPATVGDGIHLNKLIRHLSSTSTQGLRIRAFNSKEMTFIGVSDAGGVDGKVRGLGSDGLPEDPVQGAWMVLASSLLPSHDKKIPVSVLSWRSSKLKRRVTSTMASSTMALSSSATSRMPSRCTMPCTSSVGHHDRIGARPWNWLSL